MALFSCACIAPVSNESTRNKDNQKGRTDMKTQQDTQVRVVSLENLKAMCERASGTCHRYWIEDYSKTRVKVGYSNPSEYGSENPMFAVFPAYPSVWAEDEENPRVVLDMLKIVHDSWGSEGWQAFDPLLLLPVLYRDPTTGVWETKEEVETRELHSSS